MTSGSVALRAIESDALIEPSFRRLLASIEGERDRIRGTWQQIQQEREERTAELEHLRQSTEEWCLTERTKITAEWNRLDSLTETVGNLWPEETEIIDINCCGSIFTIARSSLCSIEGSVLSRVFSDEFISEVPRDEQGRFYLDFNPACFAIVIEYLQNRRLRIDAPLPVIPVEQRHNMELLAEAWKLSPFLRENRINPVHTTSLLVKKDTIESKHPGWQIISAQHPLPVAGPSYFEVTVIRNPDARGGLAIGVCGHIPFGNEVHSIRLKSSILYNSNNGLIGDGYESDKSDMTDKVQLVQGSTFGVQHDVSTHSLLFYVNRKYVGKAQIKQSPPGLMRTLYPVFALYVTDLLISVDFSSPSPSTIGASKQDTGAADVTGTVGTGTAPGRLAPPALETTAEGDEEDDTFDG